MTTLVRFHPFDSHVENLLRGFFQSSPATTSGNAVQIKVDVTEDEKSYTVRAEIPGAKKEDISIDIDGNHVSIAAEVRRHEETKEGVRVLRSELYTGRAYRSFVLGQEVDDATAEARYADGVLELVLPKKAVQTARKLTIQ